MPHAFHSAKGTRARNVCIAKNAKLKGAAGIEPATSGSAILRSTAELCTLCRHLESHQGYRRHKPGYCSYTIAADGSGGSGYRSRFSTLRRLYATMYNNPPCASIGTRARILSLEGINTTLVLWTHDKDWRNVYGLAANGRRRQQNAKVTTTSAGFEPTRAEPIRFRV